MSGDTLAELDQAVKELDALRKDADKFHRLTDQLRATEQRNRILSLIRNGATTEQVSEILAKGDATHEPVFLEPGTIGAMVKKYLDRVHTEDALTIEQLRVLENERLDALWAKVSAMLTNADGSLNLKAVDRLTRLSERRSKMNGLDAAQKHEHFIGDGLRALGLEEEHVARARTAFLETFQHQGLPDVTIEGEAELILEERVP